MNDMPMDVDEVLAQRPVERGRVEAYKARMLSDVRGHRLRELRKTVGLTQRRMAVSIGVGQRQISKIEHGQLDEVKLGTLRKYIDAIGGELVIEHVAGDRRTRIA